MIAWQIRLLQKVEVKQNELIFVTVLSFYLINEQHSWDKFCHSLIYVFINHLENK